MFIWVCTAKKVQIPEQNAIIADEGPERFSSKQFLLHCLGYVRFCANKETYICKSFFDYLHIQGRSTDQTIGHNILLLLQRNG